MKTNFELISLQVETKGEVLSSNLDQFRDSVTKALAYINLNLETDEDFEQAEEDVKCLKQAEDVVKNAKEKALKDAEELHTFFAALDASSEEVRQARLELERQIKKRKEEVRADLIKTAKERLMCADHLKDSVFDGIFDNAIKGKRSMDSIAKALDIAVATGNSIITNSRKVIAGYVAKHGNDLIPDKDELEVKDCKVVESELRRRVEAREAAVERKRLEEEAAQARAELKRRQEEERKKIDVPDFGLPKSVPDTRPVDAVTQMLVDGNDFAVEEEWNGFKDAVAKAFAGLKIPRAGLSFQRNIDRADAFSKAVGTAWRNVNTEDVQ